MPKPNVELAAYRQLHIEAWQACGLSARRFCREQSPPYKPVPLLECKAAA